MAVAFEGFSIREYTLKMRNVNVDNCWPFDEDNSKKREEIRKFLPPMICRKYRWWKNEVDNLKRTEEEEKEEGKPLFKVECGFGIRNVEIEKQEAVLRREKVDLSVVDKEMDRLGMVCPVCQIFTAATVNAVTVHIDSCLAKATKKERKLKRKGAAVVVVEAAEVNIKSTKSRKKKRSILEIFAVAPPIENKTVEAQKEEKEKENGDRFIDSIKGKQLKGKKKSRLKIKMIMKKLKMKKNTQNNKNKKIYQKIKGINDELNLPHSAGFSLPSTSSLLIRNLQMEMSDKLVIRKNKPTSKKRLFMQNKLNNSQATKLIPKQQRRSSVQSRLKNQREKVSIQKSSSISNLQGCQHTNLHQVQEPERHARFSGKDDIPGPANKWFSSLELPQIRSHQKVLSQVMDNALVTEPPAGHDETPRSDESQEVNGGEKDVIHITSGYGYGVRSTNGNKWLDGLNDHISQSNFPSPHNNSCCNKVRGFSDEYFEQNLALQQRAAFDIFSRGNSTASHNILSVGIPRSFNYTFKDDYLSNLEIQAGREFRVAADGSGPCTDPSPGFADTSSFLNSIATSKPSAVCLSTNIETNGLHQFFPQTSSVEWPKERGGSSGVKYFDEGFIGLPLNSLGELIKCSSSGKVGYSPLKKQATMASSCSFPTHNLLWGNKEKQQVQIALPRDNLKLSSEKKCFEHDPKLPLPCQLGTAGLHSKGCKCLLNSNQLENEKTQSKDRLDCGLPSQTQTTMRLMGKDVTIGIAKGDHSSEDGYIWTDKEIIAENSSSLTTYDDSSFDRHPRSEPTLHSTSQKSNETATHSWNTQTTLSAFQSNSFSPFDPYSNRRIPLVSHTRIPSFSQNHSREFQTGMDWTPRVPGSNFSQNESLTMGSQVPAPSTTSQNAYDSILFSPTQVPSNIPCNSCYHMLSSSQYKKNQSMSNSSRSPFVFPFSPQDGGEFVQPTWSRSSSQHLPQSLINAKQQKDVGITSSQPFIDNNPAHHPCGVTGCTSPISSNQKSVLRYPHNLEAGSSLHCVQNSPVGSRTSFFHPPIIPAPPGFRRPFPIKSCSNKRMKVKDRGKSNSFSRQEFDHMKAKKRSLESDDSARIIKKSNWQMHELNSTLEMKGPAGFSTSSSANFPKFDNGPRPGPIKLSAGVKHILKSNHNTIQDHSLPTSIPFGAVIDANKGPVFNRTRHRFTGCKGKPELF